MLIKLNKKKFECSIAPFQNGNSENAKATF